MSLGYFLPIFSINLSPMLVLYKKSGPSLTNFSLLKYMNSPIASVKTIRNAMSYIKKLIVFYFFKSEKLSPRESLLFYFFLIGLSLLLLHFRHRTFPLITLIGSVLILLLQSLHTKTFLKILACAAAIFAMFRYSFLFITLILSSTIMYSTWSPALKVPFASSEIAKSIFSKVSRSITLAIVPSLFIERT